MRARPSGRHASRGSHARTHERVADVCTAPPVTDSFAPRTEALAKRHEQFQRLYGALKSEMELTLPG